MILILKVVMVFFIFLFSLLHDDKNVTFQLKYVKQISVFREFKFNSFKLIQFPCP